MTPNRIGVEFLKLRDRYGWSRREAGNYAACNALTILRIENPSADGANRTVAQSTIRRIIENLATSARPITIEEAHTLADAAGIAHTALKIPARHADTAPDDFASPPGSVSMSANDAAKLIQLVFKLAQDIGVQRTEAVLQSIVAAPQARPIPTSTPDPRVEVAKQALRTPVKPALKRAGR